MTQIYKCKDCASEWHWIWIKHLKKCLDCGGECYEIKAPHSTEKQGKAGNEKAKTCKTP